MKPKTKQILINLSAIIGSVFLIVAVFFATYTYFINQSVSSYEKIVKKYSQDINVINESADSFIKGQTIDDTKVKNELDDKINKLLIIKRSVDGLAPSEKYKFSRNNFSAGLNSNIYIYKQIVQIVNNPQAKDSDKALEDLNKYKDECVKYYSLINLKNVTVSLPPKALNFIDKTNYYLGEAIKLRKKNEITQGLTSDYLYSIDEVVKSLLPIKSDYASYAVMARTGKLGEALNQVASNKVIFDDIKAKFLKITVPSNGISTFKALSKTLSTEESYIQGFSYALDIEGKQSLSAPLKPEEIKQLYADTNILYKDLNSNYEAFLKVYTEFKNNSVK